MAPSLQGSWKCKGHPGHTSEKLSFPQCLVQGASLADARGCMKAPLRHMVRSLVLIQRQRALGCVKKQKWVHGMRTVPRLCQHPHLRAVAGPGAQEGGCP